MIITYVSFFTTRFILPSAKRYPFYIRIVALLGCWYQECGAYNQGLAVRGKAHMAEVSETGFAMAGQCTRPIIEGNYILCAG